MRSNFVQWLLIVILLAGKHAVAQSEPPATPAGFIHSEQGITAGCSQKLDYPEAAAKMGAIGVTELQYMLNPDGKVLSVQVIRPSGPTREHRLLDRVAVAFLKSCEFPKQDFSEPKLLTWSYVWNIR